MLSIKSSYKRSSCISFTVSHWSSLESNSWLKGQHMIA